ncbi:MAG TPA: FAD/NAD(P)-binding oxidoreductase [Acidobacteriaceae bacterium]|nr:FAD/NAD(P)-binding oxidoreductase [Acidobacteriaceae bacterium]
MSAAIVTEVLVIGAGPAGIAAAAAAAEHGRKVIVLDDNRKPGGQIWREASSAKPSPVREKDSMKQRALERLRRSGAQLLAGRTVFSSSADGFVDALRENPANSEVERIQYGQLILATGARERFLPFPGWTLPGVFGAGGLQALVRAGYPVAGKRVVVAGTGPLLLAVAAHLAHDGATVSTVAEQAAFSKLATFTASLWRQPAKLVQGMRYRSTLRSTRYRTGCWVVEALASDGQTLSAVRLTDGNRTWTERCDLLACGYHLVPNTEIAELLGCAFEGSFVQVDEQQRTSIPNVFCVGEPTGIAGLDAALAQGEVAGLASAAKSTAALHGRVLKECAFAKRMERAFVLREELRSLAKQDTIVCRCEDVPFASLRGHTGWSEIKLQTRCGMGPCQGRVCGPAIDFLLGCKPASVRQPLYPVPLSALGSAPEPIPSVAFTQIEKL